MEFTPSQVARLVLGYLKNEKCHAAFDAFFNISPHFEYSTRNKSRSKYIVTRIHGNSLRDFLNEYADIYNLIQERLEPTDYYEGNRSKGIVDQLTYLLDKCPLGQNTPHRSRSSTPIRDPYMSRNLYHQNLSAIEETVTSELNTTPLEALPGNINEFNGVPKKRTGIKTNKNTAVEESDSGDNHESSREEEEDIEVIKQTLLEYPELHEKIADNINELMNVTDSTKVHVQKYNTELETTIKVIAEKTEADPIFQKLIGELIGEADENGELEDAIRNQTQLDLQQSIQLPSSTSQTIISQDENDSQSIKPGLGNPKVKPIKTTNISMETKLVQTERVHTTNENLYPSNNITHSMAPATSSSVEMNKNLTINTNTGEVIIYDGTLDNYVKSSTPTAQVVSAINPIVFNNNLLMVQPGLIQQGSIATPMINGIPMDKSCYMLSNPPPLHVSVPQYKLNNITEQDILNMPTVIVCDDNNRQVLASRTTKSAIKATPMKELADSNLREFVTLYKCSESPNPPKSKSQAKPQRSEVSETNVVQIEILKPVEGEKEKEPDNKAVERLSPRPVTPESNKQSVRKTTPKSGSHVRALDFNLTPGNANVKGRSPKSLKKKSPNKISATKISKSLFGSPSKSARIENEVKNDISDDTKNEAKQEGMTSWDSALRALAGPVKERSSPKKKKKETAKRQRKTSKKPKANLNNTETDAKAIEASLREMDVKPNATPIADELNKKDDDTPVKDNVNNEERKEEAVQEYVDKVDNDDEQNVYSSLTLINCDTKPRYRKKCNMDNNINKAVKITKVKELKTLEVVPDGSSKLILSPSKLNASKRTLVDNVDNEVNSVVVSSKTTLNASEETGHELPDVAPKSNDLTETAVSNENLPVITENHPGDEKKDESTTKDNGKFITPEMPRVPNVLPVSANRNLTPLLETPIKFMETPVKLNEVPRTPGADIPTNDIITPMTKMLNEQLLGVDLLTIQTPKFPLTPALSFTPYNAKSPYPNRSTDYSTTSSYYQPSDSEQNKSLEILMQECRRLEDQKPSPEKELNQSQESATIHSSISAKISSFNQSIIARKNLSLVKKDLEASSSDESSSSSDDSTLCSEYDTNSSDTNNGTVMEKKGETPYMLRSRKKDESKSMAKTETVQDTVTQTEVKPPERGKQVPLHCNEALLKEIEEKRKRTIARVKESEKAPPPKRRRVSSEKNTTPARATPRRDCHGKFLPNPRSKSKLRLKSKIESTGSVSKNTKSTVNKRKSKSPVKLAQKIDKEIEEEIRNIMFHLSSDDEHIKPFDVVETQLTELESPSTSHPLNTFQKALDSFESNLKVKEVIDDVSQREALVEGLKERGIYLVPTKTPKKIDQGMDASDEKLNNKMDITITPVTLEKKGEIQARQIETNKDRVVVVEKNIVQAETPVPNEKQKLSEKNLTERNKSDSRDVSCKLNPYKRKNIKPSLNTVNRLERQRRQRNSNNKTNKSDTLTQLDIKTKNDVSEKSNKSEVVKPDNISLEGEKVPTLKRDEASVKSESISTNQKSEQSISKDIQQKKTERKRSPSRKPSKKDFSSKDKEKKVLSQENVIKSEGDKPSEDKKSLVQESITEIRKDKPDRDAAISTEENTTKSKEDKPEETIQKNTDEKSDIPEKEDVSEPELKLQTSIVNEDLQLSDSINDEVFDDKLFAEETLKLVYDPSNTSNKSLKDYDIPVSNKCFVVEVFGQQIEMSVTSFEMILDMAEKNPNEKIKILQNTVITSKNILPLHRLQGRLKELAAIKSTSPLENLYDSDTSRYMPKKVQRLKSIERRRNSMDQKREPEKKSKKATRSKSVDCSSVLSSSKRERKSSMSGRSKSEKDSSKDTDQKKDKPSQTSAKTGQIKDVDGLSPTVKPSPGPVDDELMNYAICGSQRIENEEDDKERSTKRRSKDELEERSSKKGKYQEILNNVNVDEFLTQLHGES